MSPLLAISSPTEASSLWPSFLALFVSQPGQHCCWHYQLLSMSHQQGGAWQASCLMGSFIMRGPKPENALTISGTVSMRPRPCVWLCLSAVRLVTECTQLRTAGTHPNLATRRSLGELGIISSTCLSSQGLWRRRVMATFHGRAQQG